MLDGSRLGDPNSVSLKTHPPVLVAVLLLSAPLVTGGLIDRQVAASSDSPTEASAPSIEGLDRPALLGQLVEPRSPARPGEPWSSVDRIGEPNQASEVLGNLGISPIAPPGSPASTSPAEDELAEAPAAIAPVLGDLLEALDTATAYRDAALGPDPGSTFQEAATTRAAAEASIEAQRADPGSTASTDAISRHLEALDPLDRDLLHGGLLQLVASIEDAQQTLAGLDGTGIEPVEDADCAEGEVLFEIELGSSPLGCYLVVGGPGPNTYTRNVTLTVDLGGQDAYLNAAGGYSLPTRPLQPQAGSVLLDLGSSNDTYNSTAWDRDAVQGAGVGGYGVLVDGGGSDTYRVVDATDNGTLMAQGSGWTGAGLLWDQGQGAERYHSREGAQGNALDIGLGLLLDGGGDDTYRFPYTFDSEGGQGTACFESVAALVDQGEGNDTYRAAIDDMQGMGCVAAVGLLWDGGGPDEYLLESGLGDLGSETVVQSGWGQGYGELGAAGLLVDRSGDDRYEAEVADGGAFEGESVQGTASTGGVGLLLDGRGDDRYQAKRAAQGSATLGATGMLVDREGDDTYHANQRCQGYAWSSSGSAGVLVDGDGQDVYECGAEAYPGRWDGAAWTSGGSGTLGFLSTGVGWDLALEQAPPGISSEPTVHVTDQDRVLFTAQTGTVVELTAPDGRSMSIRVNPVFSGSVVGEVTLDGQVQAVEDVSECEPLAASLVEVEGDLVGAGADGTWTITTGSDTALGLPAAIRLEVQDKAFEDADREFGTCDETTGSGSFRHVRTWNWHASPEGTHESRATPVAPLPEVGSAVFHPAESPLFWRTFSPVATDG